MGSIVGSIVNVNMCCMVKDEQDNIIRLINSFKRIVNRVFILDTGSTDDTIKNIRKLQLDSNYPRIVLYEESFKNFVDTKNNILKKCYDFINENDSPDVKNIVMCLDADEFLKDEDIDDFNYTLKVELQENHTLRVSLNDLHANDVLASKWFIDRFWYYNKDNPLYYGGPYIHEYLITSDFGVLHKPQMNLRFVRKLVKDYHGRFNFYIEQMQQYLQDVGTNITNFCDYMRAMFYLGQTLTYMDRNDEAITYLEKYLNEYDEAKCVHPSERFYTAFSIAICYNNKKDFTRAYEWAHKSLNEYKDKTFRKEPYILIYNMLLQQDHTKDDLIRWSNEITNIVNTKVENTGSLFVDANADENLNAIKNRIDSLILKTIDSPVV